jgi:hypothetical protein
MRIGTVFEQTSTTEFLAMLDQECDSEQLLFSYVEVMSDGSAPTANSERIVARITNVYKDNPLLSRDQAGVLASVSTGTLGVDFSRRFTRGWAQCTVLGALIGRSLDMNRRVIPPNGEVHTPDPVTLRELFFNPSPSHLPLGTIETFGGRGIDEVPVTLDADAMVTKHFCIFGMTGSGKTNTAAKLVEELMARGHRMVIFDSHNDYENLEHYSNLFSEFGAGRNRIPLFCPPEIDHAVKVAIEQLDPVASEGRLVQECVRERLLRTASVIHNNAPARRFLVKDGQGAAIETLRPHFAEQVARVDPWRSLISWPQVVSYRAFPELKDYGPDFRDYTIALLSGFQGEEFTSAQWRCLLTTIAQPGTGIQFLQNLWQAVGNDGTARQETREVLQQKINGIRAAYVAAKKAGPKALDMDDLFQRVAVRPSPGRLPTPTVYRLSLSDLPANVRKTMVYAVVTNFFRRFKYSNFRARVQGEQPANAYPVLFVLEEARALIPKSSGIDDQDTSGRLARKAMQELAYEGRKFSLGYGLISQKPSTVDAEVVSQSNTFILHQLKSPDDQEYVRNVTESMSREELDMVKSLGTGRAIVAGIAVKSPVLLRVFFRYSKEGIEEPTPIRDELGEATQRIRENLGL